MTALFNISFALQHLDEFDAEADDPNLCSSINYSATQSALRVGGNLSLISIGTIFNALNIFVFTHHRMRHSMINWFLLSLAIHDQLLLAADLFMLPMPVVASELEQQGTLVALSRALTRWAFPIGHYARIGAVYTTVALSLYRYVGLCQPFWARKFVTKGRVMLLIGAAVLISCVFTLPRWIELETVACLVGGRYDTSVVSTDIGQTEFGSSRNYAFYYKMIAYTVVVFLVPVSVLFFTNISIIFALRSSSRIRRKMTSGNTENYRNSSVRHRLTVSTQQQTQAADASLTGVTAGTTDEFRFRSKTAERMEAEFKRQTMVAIDKLDHGRSPVTSLSAQKPKKKALLTATMSLAPQRQLKSSHEKVPSGKSRHRFRTSDQPQRELEQQTSFVNRDRSTANGQTDGEKLTTVSLTRETNVTLMLFAITTLFVVCNAPSVAANWLESSQCRRDLQTPCTAAFTLLAETSNLLIALNATATLPIYCAFSNRFRQRIAALFCRRRA